MDDTLPQNLKSVARQKLAVKFGSQNTQKGCFLGRKGRGKDFRPGHFADSEASIDRFFPIGVV